MIEKDQAKMNIDLDVNGRTSYEILPKLVNLTRDRSGEKLSGTLGQLTVNDDKNISYLTMYSVVISELHDFVLRHSRWLLTINLNGGTIR